MAVKSLSDAQKLDAADPLAHYRDRFFIPKQANGEDSIYFCGNSLGLQPKTVPAAIEQELSDWQRLAVNAHFDGKNPWYSYHEIFKETAARVVGAKPGEVVVMNSLTTNLHLMMVSFYQPTPKRRKILIEESAFPSDTYAMTSQIAFHGFDPKEDLLIARAREGEHCIRTEDILELIEQQGDEIATVMMAGVNFFTGQLFDLESITKAAHAKGCKVGFDLAHAAGNAPLQLHDWGVDFAVWCNYKYLNSGPGAVGACFVHSKHCQDPSLKRFAGWWGNDPSTRFQMQLLPEFKPTPSADGWQLSNPPILAMVAIKESLAIFDEAGMPELRKKSLQLTALLEQQLDAIEGDRYEILSPRDPKQRGCQLSIRIRQGADEMVQKLEDNGVICDLRKPDVIRAAPVPLYTRFEDVYRFCQILRDI